MADLIGEGIGYVQSDRETLGLVRSADPLALTGRNCDHGRASWPLLAILGVTLWWAVSAWNAFDVEMSIHGYIAMILGIVFSLVVGCGLMGLMFYSSRHGYDDLDRD